MVLKAPRSLKKSRQSVWLNHITRHKLQSGILGYYIQEWSVTGIIANPVIYRHIIKNSTDYDVAIRKEAKQGRLGEELFLVLVLEDLKLAAGLLRPLYEHTCGRDGWVSLDVSPLLIHDAGRILDAAKALFARAYIPNLMIGIPGTRNGLPAVEEAIFAGVPVNVTLLYSSRQWLAAAEAFLRGIERRMVAGLKPDVNSIASISIRPWDLAVKHTLPAAIHQRMGIAVAQCIYRDYRELLTSPRWEYARHAGAQPQRLLWSIDDATAPVTPDDHCFNSLVCPDTVFAVSELALKTLARRPDGKSTRSAGNGEPESVRARCQRAAMDVDNLAVDMQREGSEQMVKDWIELMSAIAYKTAALANFSSSVTEAKVGTHE
jgi:transaldolase